MPLQVNEPARGAGAAAGSRSDVFLFLQGMKNGRVKGEATSEGHVDDIQLQGWSWGAQAGSAMGSQASTARRSYRPLVVYKDVDCASVVLLRMLATNDEVKEARLTMRKSGGGALDYFRISLNGARVADLSVDVDAQGHPVEKIVLTYTKIEVEYTPQSQAGAGGGSVTHTDDVLPG